MIIYFKETCDWALQILAFHYIEATAAVILTIYFLPLFTYRGDQNSFDFLNLEENGNCLISLIIYKHTVC